MPGPKNYLLAKPRPLGQSPAAQPEQPEELDQPSAARRYGAGGVRVLSAIGSSEGLWPGALISGLGEAAAEIVEGSPLSMERIMAEAALGAIPLSKVFKAGKIPYSMVRGGLYSGGGEATRQLSQAEDWSPEGLKKSLDPGAIATSGGLGALLGGALSKLQRIPKSAQPKPPPEGFSYEVTPTAQTGPGTLTITGGKIIPGTRTVGAKTTGGKLKESQPIAKIPGTAPPDVAPSGVSGGAKSAILYVEDPESPALYRASAKQAVKAEEQAALATAKEARVLAAKIAAKEAGLVEKSSYGESVSAPLASGATGRVSTKYVDPNAAEESVGRVATQRSSTENAASPLAQLLRGKASSKARTSVKTPEGFNAAVAKNLEQVGTEAAPKVQPAAAAAAPALPVRQTPPAATVVVAPTGAEVAGDVPDHLNPLVKLSRGWSRGQKMERMQQLYSKETQAAIDAEAKIYNNLATSLPDKRAAGARMAGLAQEEEARLAAAVGAKTPPVSSEVPVASGVADFPASATPGTPEQFAELQGLLGKAFKNQKGEISPRMLGAMSSATGGAIGAAGGAAMDDENPWQGAITGGLAGAALGAAAPMVASQLARLGAPKEIVAEAAQPGATPKGIVDRVKSAWELFPQYQRFSYLSDAVGLPANSLVGPYGSAFFGGLERQLAGDPRGAAALKMMSPENFLEEFGIAFREYLTQGVKSEAASLIGRAEGHALTGLSTRAEKFLAAPGVTMTAGDLAARRILMRAGFTEAEARTITLTSEPVLPFGKFLANAGRNSTLLQVLFPFRRTPANIMEQGAERIPLLGSIINKYKAEAGMVPDSLKLQAIKQGMGLGVGVASGAVGASVDPETAKWVRRYVSNFGGQYSLPATMGFAAGQAMRSGKPMAKAAATAAGYALPLPSAEPAVDWGNYIFSGGPLGDAPLPRGAIPAVMRKADVGPNFLSDLLAQTAGPVKRVQRGPRNYLIE